MIKAIALSAAPKRKIVKGVPIPEIQEVIAALPTLKKEQALTVTLSVETAKRLSTGRKDKVREPVSAFVQNLKRTFSNQGLSFTAYKSGEEIIVIHEKEKEKEKTSSKKSVYKD